MGTTYQRIGIVLKLINDRDFWAIDDLIAAIRAARSRDFKVRGDGTSDDDYMSAASIGRLVTLIDDLGLTATVSKQVFLTAPGRRCAEGGTLMASQIRSSVDSVLESYGIDRARLKKAISKIRLPSVPDAVTLFEGIGSAGPKVSIPLERFRTLLFLSACADGMERVVKVHYVA